MIRVKVRSRLSVLKILVLLLIDYDSKCIQVLRIFLLPIIVCRDGSYAAETVLLMILISDITFLIAGDLQLLIPKYVVLPLVHDILRYHTGYYCASQNFRLHSFCSHVDLLIRCITITQMYFHENGLWNGQKNRLPNPASVSAYLFIQSVHFELNTEHVNENC